MTVIEFFKSLNKDAVLATMQAHFPYTLAIYYDSPIRSLEYYSKGYNNIVASTHPASDEYTMYIGNGGSRDILLGKNKAGVTYGFTMCPWNRILPMQVDEGMFDKYSKEYIAAVMLIDICFGSNDEESNDKRINNVFDTLRAQENDESEAVPAEDVFKGLNDMLKDVPPDPKIGDRYKDLAGNTYEVVLVGEDVSGELIYYAIKDIVTRKIQMVPCYLFNKELKNPVFADGSVHKFLYRRV